MNQFKNLYSLSKTIRFELIPLGKTLENINKKGLLTQDENRAESYKKVKKIIDEFHKKFINDTLNEIKINIEDVENFESLFFKKNKDDNEKKELQILQNKLRSQISDNLKNNSNYKNLYGKELFKNNLKENINDENQKKLIQEFDKFITYFNGFDKNRENIYKKEDISTAVPYRIIHDNLPKFLSNKRVFNKIEEKYPDLIKDFDNTDCFTNNNFNKTLTQIDIDRYNLILADLNQKINLFRQKNNLRKSDIPNMEVLYKQILSDKESKSWLPEKFESDIEVLQSIENFYQYEIINWENENQTINLFDDLKKLFANLTTFNKEKIYIKNLDLKQISKRIFNDWSIIKTALENFYEHNNPDWDKTKKNQEKKEKYIKKEFYTISEIEKALKYYSSQNDGMKNLVTDNILSDYFNKWGIEDTKNLFEKINENYNNVKELLINEYPKNKKLIQDGDNITKLKNFLDGILNLLHFIKPLYAEKLSEEKDDAFYADYNKLYKQLTLLTPLYNKTRNYLSQKSYSVKKYKLNFENPTLLNGWDKNKESANTSVLLRKDGNYYLGIMDKKHNKIFENIHSINEDESFEKIIYKLLPGANKMLPKVFLSKKGIENFKPSQEIINNYKRNTHKKGDTFVLDDCHKLIDYFKDSINKHEDWKNFGFQFSDTKSYEDLSDFYKEVEKQGYKISFQNISKNYIDKLVEEGKLYLFKIYNKDFSSYSKGRPNLFTIYWNMLFNEQNLKDVVYELNGQAELFYRKKSIINKEITHPANIPIANKNSKSKNNTTTLTYDIIKDKRFAQDKFFFHVPITLNFKAEGQANINLKVHEYIQQNPDIKVIGIDRGERNLLYLSIIDKDGAILDQINLNEIINYHNNEKYSFDYKNKLQEVEKRRAEARESWQTIENIKELKEGYISQVVHKISKMMVEKDAILVMEDLNFGFKNGRFKVEKQVYQKFEKMLIEKLNYYVDKNKENTEIGGTLNALQLTNKFTSFKELGKQSGFIFYVPAWNTSKIDPKTGFVNYFYTKYENKEKAKEFFGKFKNIQFNPIAENIDEKDNKTNGYFEFIVDDYTQFNPKAEGTQQKWIICTYGPRIINFRNADNNNQWESKEINLTDEFIDFFDKHGIDYKENLQQQIIQQDSSQFFAELYKLFYMTVQLRNSFINSDKDYLLSPVKDPKTEGFYDSRKYAKQENPKLPKDADANGAYNIARKGLWVLEKIRQTEDLSKKINLAISNKEWLNFVQNKNYES